MKHTIGIDIGGTKCAVLLGAPALLGTPPAILHKICFDTPSGGPQPSLEKIYAAISDILSRAQLTAGDVSGIGISCGGPLNSATGRILSPPNLPGWDDVAVVQALEQRFGVPAALQNDANACALAEWRFGAGQGCQNLIFLTFGTGMGAGLVLDGRLYNGTCGLAGETGHVRLSPQGPVGFGKAGSFEGWCSGGGIAQLARTRALEQLQAGIRPAWCATVEALPAVNAKTVAAAALTGDTLALSIYSECAERLGQGLAMLVDLLNPECIVIGSIFQRAERLFYPTLRDVLAREALPAALACCEIKPAALGDAIGDYAALSVALEACTAKEGN